MNPKLLLKLFKELKPEEKDVIHDEIANDMIERIKETVGIEEVPEIKPLMDFYDEAKANMRTKGKLTGMSTGLPTLDDINGGLDKEELIVITGETGIGKTNLAMNILYHLACQGNPVLFFTLEMSPMEVTQRFIQLDQEQPTIATKPIFYYTGKKEVGRGLLRDAIRHGVNTHGIKCVLVDHLHYFSKKGEASDNRVELEVITREIKLMAREFAIPIILIAHTRKLPGNQSRPYLADIKDTSAVAQDADQVIIVWRNNKSSDANDRYTLYFEVAKNRLKGKCDEGSFKIDKHWRLIDGKQPPMQFNQVKELFI